ncbi:S-adenosylmethionine synthetase N-terminal domain-containing protein [Streptomyces sp. NBC_00989]|uniref:S-adenosylmethionine synthetase N-terminal domain-containing protein n=1 Tax=Streptomyces sp. NBC_00989 TaxID=2903705 RepID=UPI0038659122|nr:S-adenosylmethionine synthetase N-terminal domain-containing protein [Streptomyces sp. NBC_00989]
MSRRLSASESVAQGHSDKIASRISDTVLDALPRRDRLALLRPVCAQTAACGRFGRELPDFTGERTDRVRHLRAAAGP